MTRLVRGLSAIAVAVGALSVVNAAPASAHDGRGPYAATTVAAGVDHTCAVQRDATVACWGSNTEGQLGNGSMSPSPVTVPVTVVSLRDARALAAGDRFTCALRANGKVVCWGRGLEAQLGNGDRSSSAVPVETRAGFDDVVAISAGGTNACALQADGRIECWGDSDDPGRFGSDVQADARLPSGVQLSGPAIEVSVGTRFACAVLVGGSVACWGRGGAGQLGDGSSLSSTAPVIVALTGARSVSAGDDHACASLPSGLRCWGGNADGQLGNGTTTPSAIPVDVVVPSVPSSPAGPFGNPWIGAVMAGRGRTCADGEASTQFILTTSLIFCWGRSANDLFRPGAASTSDILPPAGPRVTAPFYVIASWDEHLLAVGAGHVCAGLGPSRDIGVWSGIVGSAFCWGANESGQAPGSPPRPASPVQPALTDLSARRVLDTRAGSLVGYTGAKPGAGAVVTVQIDGGAAAAPAEVRAVALNVTGTDATADGYVTVWPCDQPRPGTSSLNLVRGEDRSNWVLATTSTTGTVCLFTQSGTHLVVDLQATVPSVGTYHPIAPERLMDTRTAVGDAKVTAPGSYTLSYPKAEGGFIPDGVTLVANITATGAVGDGHVTVWDCYSNRPLASILNLRAGETVAVGVLVTISHFLCLYTNSGADLVVDVSGWFAPSGALGVLPAATRALDTRSATRTGTDLTAKPAAGAVTVASLAVVAGTIPASGARGVVLSVTATEAEGAGWVRAVPCSVTDATSSNLNVPSGGTRANLVVVDLPAGASAADLRVCLTSNVAVHLVVDVAGWLPARSSSVTKPA